MFDRSWCEVDLNSKRLADEVRLVREKGKGLTRLDQLRLPLLTEAARIVLKQAVTEKKAPAAIEKLLRLAVARLGDGVYGKGAAAALGLAQGTRGLGPRERQEKAAEALDISTAGTYRRRLQNEQMANVAGQIEVLVAESSSSRSDPSPALITVRLGINPQTGYHKREIDLTGDLDSWCSGVRRARYGRPMPPTEVVMEIEPEPIVGMYQGLEETPASIQRDFETFVNQVYGVVFEDAVIEIARLGLQYLPHYYHDGSGVKLLIEAVLNSPWRDSTFGKSVTYKVYASYEGALSTPISLPRDCFERLVERSGKQLSYRFLSTRVGWATDLGEQLNTTVVLPAIIGTWMQYRVARKKKRTHRHYKVDDVLNPAAWKLTLDLS
jgi:hypothetical protein